MVQWASRRRPEPGSACTGLAIQLAVPRSSRTHSIATALARSPSHAATVPRSLSSASARQPDVPRRVTRSKQRTATASRRWPAASSSSAVKTPAAWRTAASSGSRVAVAPVPNDAASAMARAPAAAPVAVEDAVEIDRHRLGTPRAPHRLGGGDAGHEPVGRGAHEADPAPVEPPEGAQVVDRGREPRERRSVVRSGQVHDAAAGAVLAQPGERLEGRRQRVVRGVRDEEERVPGRGGLPRGVEAQDLGLRPPGPHQHDQGIGRTEGGLRGLATAERRRARGGSARERAGAPPRRAEASRRRGRRTVASSCHPGASMHHSPGTPGRYIRAPCSGGRFPGARAGNETGARPVLLDGTGAIVERTGR